MYLLFKKNVQGEEPSDFEMKETVKMLNSEDVIFSNISRLMFDHPDFIPFMKKTLFFRN